jgi:Tol biopolymer transport system component
MQRGGKKMVKTNPLGALAAGGGALVAVGLLVLMLVVVEARPAEATFPGQNGRIAYYAYDGLFDDEIYTIMPTGGTPFQVTNNEFWREGEDRVPLEDRFPSYSPDGTKIAYVGFDENVPVETDYEIFTINATGGTPFQVTHDTVEGGDVSSPSYSPDGERIAYSVYSNATGNSEIYTIDATGGTPFNVTKDSTGLYHSIPDYSPDGETIAYVGFDGHDDEIYTIAATGGTPVKVTNNDTADSNPSYSPNGRKIAYAHWDGNDSEIYKISPTGGTPVKVTNNRRPDLEPSYSPNGRKIAYLSYDGHDYEIYKIDHNGGTPVKVTNNETNENGPSWGSRP